MDTKDFIGFMENLSVVKDVEKKSQLIKTELNKLNQLIKENEVNEYNSRLEKIKNQTEYLEFLSYKNVLSFRLSLLQTELSIK
ncbi:MAG: hypothetical protein WAU11_06075 [Ignavibacteriaceae bacterium]